jgi:dihydroorotate dehydrogenase (fumarate)
MLDLTTKYAGLELKNPIVLGASKLSAMLPRIKEAEKAGVAAIVAPSLFEEQINYKNLIHQKTMENFLDIDSEMQHLFPDGLDDAGPNEHLYWLKKTKEEIEIPVIASLNCVNKETWIEYSKKIEETGVDAIELNFFHVPDEFDKTATEIEEDQLDTIKTIVNELNIPVTVKLSFFYSNSLNFIKRVSEAGVAGVILFNRLFQPSVKIETEEHISPFKMSVGSEKGISLRYAGLLHGEIDASIISNTGFYFGEDIVAAILMGADAVQAVSTFIVNRIEYVATMLKDIRLFMENHNYQKLDDFRGKLARKNVKDKIIYRRGQYVDMLFHSEKILQGNFIRDEEEE